MNPMSPLHTVTQNEVQLSIVNPVRVVDLEVMEDVPAHDHEYTEICIVGSGEAVHQSDSQTDVLHAGSVIIVPPGPSHAFVVEERLYVTNTYYLAEWFLWDLNFLWQNEGLVSLFFAPYLFRRSPAQSAIHFSLTSDELQACMYELEDIRAESLNVQPSAFWIRGAFSKLLMILARAWKRQSPAPDDFNFRREVWAALCAMDTNIKNGEPFCVETFARGVGFSPDAFSRMFRSATGLSPSEYFQSRRVQHAGHLLLRSQSSVSEIAHQLGYADGAHLTRFFQKHKKCSPTEFRKLYRLNQN